MECDGIRIGLVLTIPSVSGVSSSGPKIEAGF